MNKRGLRESEEKKKRRKMDFKKSGQSRVEKERSVV